MSSTVVGIFEYTSEAQEAQKYLLANGFSNDNVDIKVSSTGTISDTSGYEGTTGSTLDTSETYKTDNSTWDTTSPYKKEDNSDGIAGFFRNLFGDDDDEVPRYSEAGRKGTIVTVHARTADEAEAAARILDNFGAVDVNENSSKAFDSSSISAVDSSSVSAVDSSYSSDDNSYTSDVVSPTTDSTSIPIIEEELQVGKREVQTGGVRLKSRIVERPVEESIRLRQEFVNVERTTVNRVATDADFNTFKEGTIEIIEHAEVPVVSKEARVVEEVSFGKEVTEREEVISDTVRRTEVETEELSDKDSTIRRTDSDKYSDQ